jgi:hypothetical protein
MDEMRAQLQPHREITVTLRDEASVARLKEITSDIPEVIAVTDLEARSGRFRVRLDFSGDDEGVANLNTKIAGAGIAILGFAEETKDLEAMFMRVTKGIVS